MKKIILLSYLWLGISGVAVGMNNDPLKSLYSILALMQAGLDSGNPAAALNSSPLNN